jgi:hypothetical protein
MDPNETPSVPSSDKEAPEKYIRTYETDVDIFQRGGTPGLAPLKSAPRAPAERLIEASPITQVATNAPFEVPAPAPKPPVEPPAPKAPAKPVPIETYSEDFRERLKETHASTATVLAAEQDAGPHEEPEPEAPPADTRSRWYIAASVLLLLLGGAGVYVAYSKYIVAVMPVAIGPLNNAPIFVDSSETVSGSGSALAQAIVQSIAKPLTPNTVRELRLVSATSTNVFLSLGMPVPGIIARNVQEAGSMAGIVNAGGAQSPFFILSVDLYNATFSGMLAWEPTVQRDMKSLYPLYPAASPPTSLLGTSTPSSAATSTATTSAPAIATKPVFRDEVVSNHDVRVYRDALGRSILLYGYWNPTTLIIARDPVSFGEILDRLATSHN